MPSTWAPIVFWVLLVPLLVVMLVVYLRSKQFYRLVYILSVFTYAMTIMYWIDAYRLGRNAIVGLLVASSLLMIFIGYTMHKKVKKKVSQKNWKIATACMIIIGIIVALSASPIGWAVSKQATQSVRLSDVYKILEEGQPDYGPGPGVPLYSITITNTFIPRQYELPQANACLYNTEKKAGTDVPVQWDISEKPLDFGPSLNTVEMGRETKTITLKAMPYTRWKPVPRGAPVPAKEQELEVYDQLLLFLHEGRVYEYTGCYNLQPQDFEKAIKISIVQN